MTYRVLITALWLLLLAPLAAQAQNTPEWLAADVSANMFLEGNAYRKPFVEHATVMEAYFLANPLPVKTSTTLAHSLSALVYMMDAADAANAAGQYRLADGAR